MSKRLSTAEFIEKAQTIHENKFNYSEVIYKNNRTKVKIKCPKHGVFTQIPYDHLLGFGCQRCDGTFRLTTEEFIARSIIKHGNKYNYSKTIYRNKRSKVAIICPKHGKFKQVAREHYYGGCGCPECGHESKGEEKVAEILNKKKIKHERQYKFNSCKNQNPLPFDFAFWQNQKISLIEYQGNHHYEPRGFGGDAEENYKNTIKNDKIKKRFTRLQNIPLLKIPFYKYEDIENLIDQFV